MAQGIVWVLHAACKKKKGVGIHLHMCFAFCPVLCHFCCEPFCLSYLSLCQCVAMPAKKERKKKQLLDGQYLVWSVQSSGFEPRMDTQEDTSTVLLQLFHTPHLDVWLEPLAFYFWQHVLFPCSVVITSVMLFGGMQIECYRFQQLFLCFLSWCYCGNQVVVFFGVFGFFFFLMEYICQLPAMLSALKYSSLYINTGLEISWNLSLAPGTNESAALLAHNFHRSSKRSEPAVKERNVCELITSHQQSLPFTQWTTKGCGPHG